MAKKLSKADAIEKQIRDQFLPAQFANTLEDIMQIDLNAEWRATKEGKEHAEKVDGYSKDELAQILRKQAERKASLVPKVEFMRRKINES